MAARARLPAIDGLGHARKNGRRGVRTGSQEGTRASAPSNVGLPDTSPRNPKNPSRPAAGDWIQFRSRGTGTKGHVGLVVQPPTRHTDVFVILRAQRRRRVLRSDVLGWWPGNERDRSQLAMRPMGVNS